MVHLVAHNHRSPESLRGLARAWPTPVQNPVSPICRVIRECTTLHVSDTESDPTIPESGRERTRPVGVRSMLVVPLVRDGVPIGAIRVSRPDPTPFSDTQIELLKTFADQAVIAIENVRLFNELKEKTSALAEALDQQTATAEILRVISSSPIDLQPVFDTVVRNAVKLCGAAFGGLHRLDRDRITLEAQYGVPADELTILQRDVFPIPLSRESATGRAILDRAIAHIRDIREDQEFRTPRLKTMQDYRTILAVPMVREGIPIGALALWRSEVQPFTETEIGLVQTFADQAVIAIENVRLFKELEARNRDLFESLEQQTATAEVLASSVESQTDVQPVFDTIVRSAARLCDGLFSTLFQFDGELLHIIAVHNTTPEALEALHRVYPARPTRALVAGQAILERTVIHISDAELQPESEQRAVARAVGWRSALIRPDAARGRSHRRDHGGARRDRAVLRQRDRAAEDLRRPGRDRHRERPPVQGTGSANSRADPVGREADGAGRGQSGPQLDARPRHCARRRS